MKVGSQTGAVADGEQYAVKGTGGTPGPWTRMTRSYLGMTKCYDRFMKVDKISISLSQRLAMKCAQQLRKLESEFRRGLRRQLPRNSAQKRWRISLTCGKKNMARSRRRN